MKAIVSILCGKDVELHTLSLKLNFVINMLDLYQRIGQGE